LSRTAPDQLATVLEVEVDDSSSVFEHGWQSFSPTTSYRLGDRPHRPASERNRILNYRESSRPNATAYFGEGILAVDDGSRVHVVAGEEPFTTGVRVRAERKGSILQISSDGAVTVTSHPRDSDAADPMQSALRRWATAAAQAHAVPAPRAAPTGWCSWYQYYGDVSDRDVTENLNAMDDLELDIDVVQLDDGYEAAIGDWLDPARGFTGLREFIGDIRERGRRAGIWVAPYFAGASSRLADEHPDWLVRHPHGGPLHAGHNWNQDLYPVDLTHPAAAGYIHDVFATFASWGIDYFKIDFLAAGAITGNRYSGADPISAYREGLRLIREAVGPQAHILGCGAPVLPSVGLVDSIRVSADTDTATEPGDGDLSSPGQRGAVLSARGRQFMNGVFFVNDPDCLIARPAVQDREGWAAHVSTVGGAVVSSDRLNDLDEWGLETTRELLTTAKRRNGDLLPR
jgi:alpha-galactosidase